MLWSRVVAGLASLVALAEAVSNENLPMDLGSVLGRHPKLSTYYKLIKKYPDILLQLPNYKGVTVS
jgi:transforming growth factor-beta-induced protein